MEVDSPKKGKVNQLLIVISGLVILLGAVLTYIFILNGVFGSFNISGFMPNIESIKKIFIEKKPQVAILYSKYTENMLPEGSTWLADNITTWKKFLDEEKITYELISDETIELGNHYDYKIIVLPGSKSLSDKETTQLKKYLDKGGSTFVTSGPATYSDNGKWRGWEFCSEVFGFKFTKEIENDEVSKIHTLRGGLPLTANIPTGFPLKVATWDKPIAVEVLDPRSTQVSFWYNYRTEEGLVREEIKKSAGIVYGTYGSGRFVWMGFEINSVIGFHDDYVYFERLFKNSLNWLSFNPTGFIKEWPKGYDAAAVIAPSLTQDIGNISSLLPILDSEKVQATFFVEPEEAGRFKELIKNISRYGEVAAIIDIGYLSSINDTINQLNDYYMQVNKLKEAKSILQGITNKTTSGLLPYYGLFDQNTLKALIDAGYKYVLTDSLTDRSVPKTIIRGDDRIISMTKTARDDYEVVRNLGLSQPEFQFYTYQEDIDRVMFEGGMYVFKLHPEFQCRPENINVVKNVIRDLKNKNFWITTADEIQEWYQKKNYAEIRIEKRGESRVVVKVSNPGTHIMEELTVQVELTEDAENLKINTEIINTPPAKIQYDKKTRNAYLLIRNLKAGESRIYYLDYSKPNV